MLKKKPCHLRGLGKSVSTVWFWTAQHPVETRRMCSRSTPGRSECWPQLRSEGAGQEGNGRYVVSHAMLAGSNLDGPAAQVKPPSPCEHLLHTIYQQQS